MTFYICPFDIKCIRLNSTISPAFRHNEALSTKWVRIYDTTDNHVICVFESGDSPPKYMRDANVIDKSLSFRRTLRRYQHILNVYSPTQIVVMGCDSGTQWVADLLAVRSMAVSTVRDWDIPPSPDDVYTDGTGLVGIGAILEIIDWKRIRLQLMKDILYANSTDIVLEKITRKLAKQILENMLSHVYAI